MLYSAPYGVRAGAKTLGRKGGVVRDIKYDENGVPTHTLKDYIPATKPLEMTDVLRILLQFAARHLKMNGRLVYWLPTIKDDYEDAEIPQHPALQLVANSEQPFGNWSRRLITMQKIAEDYEQDASVGVAYDSFREKYFAADK